MRVGESEGESEGEGESESEGEGEGEGKSESEGKGEGEGAKLNTVQYWAIEGRWFAQVNALCNHSRKKSRKVVAATSGPNSE